MKLYLKDSIQNRDNQRQERRLEQFEPTTYMQSQTSARAWNWIYLVLIMKKRPFCSYIIIDMKT